MEQPILPFISKYRKYYQSLEPFFKKKKTKSYTTVIFFFLVLSLFSWYAIKPTIQTILYLQREIRDKTEVNKAMDTKINALIQAQIAYENAQPLLPLIRQAVPEAPDAITLISHIGKAAEISGASISAAHVTNIPITIEVASGSAKQKLKQTDFPVTFTIDGSYAALKMFIEEIISFRRILRITSINFIPADKKSEISTFSASLKPKLRLVLQVSSYFMSP